MIIDCHTHFNPSQEEDSSEHQQALESVDYCFVLADPELTTKKDHKPFADYINRRSDKMAGFANINPVDIKGGVGKIEKIFEKFGFKGAVLYCSENGFHPAHSKAMQFYEIAREKQLPLFFHNSLPLIAEGILDYSQPVLLDEIARNFPELKMIISNMGYPFTDQTLAMVLKHKNVYADLTINPSNIWQVYNTVLNAYEQKATEKLLFGSGFPHGNPNTCIETLLGFNKLLGDTNLPNVPRGQIRKIIERNALELLGIEK